jgi:hypothetical protein
VFGVYPFGIAGGQDGVVSGPPDDIGLIGQALGGLAGDGPPLVVRMYVTFEGMAEAALDQVAQFAQMGNLVDLSLNFHDRDGDVDQWCSFVEQVVRRHGAQVGSIGVTNEANLLDVPFAPDGAYPNALEALADGVAAAAEAKSAQVRPLSASVRGYHARRAARQAQARACDRLKAVAVDGKTSRGARRADGTRVHLLGVAEHGGHLLDHLELDVKHNETSHFTALLEPPGPGGCRGDLHMRAHAASRVSRGLAWGS